MMKHEIHLQTRKKTGDCTVVLGLELKSSMLRWVCFSPAQVVFITKLNVPVVIG